MRQASKTNSQIFVEQKSKTVSVTYPIETQYRSVKIQPIFLGSTKKTEQNSRRIHFSRYNWKCETREKQLKRILITASISRK
jgi:hypothetical protein